MDSTRNIDADYHVNQTRHGSNQENELAQSIFSGIGTVARSLVPTSILNMFSSNLRSPTTADDLNFRNLNNGITELKNVVSRLKTMRDRQLANQELAPLFKPLPKNQWIKPGSGKPPMV